MYKNRYCIQHFKWVTLTLKIYSGNFANIFVLDRIEKSLHAFCYYVLLVFAGSPPFLFTFTKSTNVDVLKKMSEVNENENLQACTVCSAPTTNKCSSCKSVSYCSKDHQKEDWKNHKDFCRPFEVRDFLALKLKFFLLLIEIFFLLMRNFLSRRLNPLRNLGAI